MRILHSFGIYVACLLVSQDFVHATIEIIDSFSRTVDSFQNRYATENDVTMEGYIESANPSDACSEIGLPTFPKNFTMKKIVLINGTSTCDFMTKVHNAKAVGYDIAVLFDPLPEPFEYPNLTFPVPISEDILVVLVLFEDAIVIRNNYLYHNISDKDNFIMRVKANVPTWKIVMAYISFGVLIMVLCCVVVDCLKWVKKTCFGGRDEDREDLDESIDSQIEQFRNAVYDVMIRMLNEQIARQDTGPGAEEQRRKALFNLNRRYPLVEFSKDYPFEVCVVCCDDLAVGQSIRVLGCSHAYHADCIDAWLVHQNRKDTCPMCVAKVNLENSCEVSPPDSTETTRLLISTHSLYSSSRKSNGIGPSESTYDNPLRSTDESGERLAEVEGSVNHSGEGSANHSDEGSVYHSINNSDEDQQGFMV